MSYIGPQMLAQIDKRLRNIMGVDELFGGLSVIFLGDSFQLPPVKPAETPMSAVIKCAISTWTQKVLSTDLVLPAPNYLAPLK